MSITNRLYNILKWLGLIAIPAASSFYFGIASVWNLGHVEQVMGTLALVGTLIGALIGVTSKSYTPAVPVESIDGQLIIDESDGVDDARMRVHLDTPPKLGQPYYRLQVLPGKVPTLKD